MFHDLFNDEDAQPQPNQSDSKGSAIPKASSPRGPTRLCGLSNLGATCYLNSLLQTLHHTPEFREALFSLREQELGVGTSPDNSMVRAIPIQLQHLFVRLLLLDQSSASVTALTDSFGWTNNEELQQHDVQELNRILFSAIESSLLGTSGEKLISKLYHGSTVQQITCQVCSRVSEREEEFLDIPVALSGHASLEETLHQAFIKLETLTAPNQYFCGSCQTLVDAKRGCHIRKLPAILTFALLRFLYDFKKGERYKDTSRFKFPMMLDMSPYCEASEGDCIYQLFSVVIHSGSTHSGHYTAFIRDVDDLGHWTHPEEEPVTLQVDPVLGKVDVIDCENPADLLATLLRQLNGSSSISTLCKRLQDQTGVTWNKRFKKQFGPVVKFMKSCSDLFVFSDASHVSLKPSQEPPSVSCITPSDTESAQQHTSSPVDTDSSLNEATEKALKLDMNTSCGSDVKMASPEKSSEKNGKSSCQKAGEEEKEEAELDVGKTHTYKPRVKPVPPPGHRWFEFNDATVNPIQSQAIDKMFQGKKSAYMLFYRKQSLLRPPEARKAPTFGVPEHLVMEMVRENSKLEEERSAYEVAINTIRLNLHYHSQYCYDSAALHRTTDIEPFAVSIDGRKTIHELKNLISESYPELMKVGDHPAVIHTAKFLPAGMHLYDIISDKDEASLAALDLRSDCHLFLWDGVGVGGEGVMVGEDSEPVQFSVTYSTVMGKPAGGLEGRWAQVVARSKEGEESGQAEMLLAFNKNSTLREVKVALSGFLGVQPSHVTISQVKLQERRGKSESSVVVLSSSRDRSTLSQLSLSDGDRLIVESSREIRKGVHTLAHSVADRQKKMLSFIVEDRCMLQVDPFPVYPIEMARDSPVATLKTKILSQSHFHGDVRFRVETDACMLGPPLYETQALVDGEIEQGLKVVMESGTPPQENQIFLQCRSSVSQLLSEVIVEKGLSVGECCGVMSMALGLTGDCWHLRKTNWCGEEADILEDEVATLESEKLQAGELLIVEQGKLPPKGYLRLSILLFVESSQSSFQQPVMVSEGSPSMSESTSCSSYVSASNETSTSSRDISMPSSSVLPAPHKSELHLVPPSTFYPPLPGELMEVGTVEVSREASVEDLKVHILTLPAFHEAFVPSSHFVRVRELTKNLLGKIFKQDSHTLRRLKLKSGAQLCCQILDHEEKLLNSSVVFYICQKDPQQRQYGPLKEVVYDTAESASPHAFCLHLSKLLDVPLDKLQVAKHKVEQFEWIIIDSSQEESKRGRKKAHGAGGASIKNSPVMLRDGDTVGFMDLRQCAEKERDFSTALDDQGKAVLLAIQEDKRKRRKAKEDMDVFGPKEKRQRRPERGIKIYVPDYRSKP